jgi:hypothetical protein
VNWAGTRAAFDRQKQTLNMFNLERSIADWRRRMLAAGIKTPMTLDELESHLRADIRALLAEGEPEDQAFQLAVSRLGSPGPLRTEFNKVKNTACWPVKICSSLFVVAILLTALGAIKGLIARNQGLLLGMHVVVITAGYGAAFLAGGFGIFYVCYRLFHSLTPHRQQSLDRAVLLFSQVSTALVIIGFGLGMLWCRQHFGKLLMGDVKEVGALCVVIWFIALSVTQRRRLVSERVTMLMCIAGNIVVSLAWFGAGILVVARKMHAGGAGYWPLVLAIIVGIHVLFLVIGLAPAPAEAES